MTLDQRHVAGIVVRAVGLPCSRVFCSHWSGHGARMRGTISRPWTDGVSSWVRELTMGVSRRWGAMRMVPGTSKMLLSLHRSVPRD